MKKVALSSGLGYRPSGLPLQKPDPGACVVVVVVVAVVVVLAPGFGVVVEGSGGSSAGIRGHNFSCRNSCIFSFT